MKTLYLWIDEKGWTPFQYNELSELTKEFVSRNIKLGDGCKMGDKCKLGDGCTLGDWCEPVSYTHLTLPTICSV